MIKSILIASTLILALTSCSSIPNIIKVDTAPVDRPELVVPNVDKFTTRPVEWTVLTQDNYEEIFKKLKDNNIDVVLFTITDDGYENLSLNMADIIKLIQQQEAIIAAYQQYTDEDAQ
tara:strand:+ start:422 stop:775 length:354 start_codon:yes stop_codon:yes gene_type:complete